MNKLTGLLALTALSFAVYAGGNPEFVAFPSGYQDDFSRYSTQNRGNNQQVADLYANEVALESVKNGTLASGSVIVMEVYKPKKDDAGNIVTGRDGMFEKSELAAIAVMERRANWSGEFAADHRTGGWGFAIYDPRGNPKANDLDCVSCHSPLADQQYLFSYDALAAH